MIIGHFGCYRLEIPLTVGIILSRYYFGCERELTVYQGRTVFSQLMDFLPMHKFRQCVDRYQGNKGVRTFTCLDQFMCMAFAQLTYRESLRDIECCLRAMREKLYHIGFRGNISRSTLADANEKRDWHIYSDFAQILIH